MHFKCDIKSHSEYNLFVEIVSILRTVIVLQTAHESSCDVNVRGVQDATSKRQVVATAIRPNVHHCVSRYRSVSCSIYRRRFALRNCRLIFQADARRVRTKRRCLCHYCDVALNAGNNQEICCQDGHGQEC